MNSMGYNEGKYLSLDFIYKINAQILDSKIMTKLLIR